jgi:hypothetical protein
MTMNIDLLIAQGNQYREDNQPAQALRCYATAFVEDANCVHAWNNYGNVLREMGEPKRALPFLQHALALDPTNTTSRFNLAVTYLLDGNYEQGWPAYEARWDYEHLAGTLPKFSQPKWTGQDLQGKTILVIGEQGHGDNIQFVRFVSHLVHLGATVLLQVTEGLIPLLKPNKVLSYVGNYVDPTPTFDYWVPIMSLPGVIGLTVDNIPKLIGYLGADQTLQNSWRTRLGLKHKLQVGISWSGRRDSWINKHKSVPFETILELVKKHPECNWVNLQLDATEQEFAQLDSLGVKLFHTDIDSFADTAALIMNLDLVVSVDTAVAHLAGALGRPSWIMLNQFAVDWRWLLNRNDSPWYRTAKLFRQPVMGDWHSVLSQVSWHLSLFKI